MMLLDEASERRETEGGVRQCDEVFVPSGLERRKSKEALLLGDEEKPVTLLITENTVVEGSKGERSAIIKSKCRPRGSTAGRGWSLELPKDDWLRRSLVVRRRVFALLLRLPIKRVADSGLVFRVAARKSAIGGVWALGSKHI